MSRETQAEAFVRELVAWVRKSCLHVETEVGIVTCHFVDGTYADFTEPKAFSKLERMRARLAELERRIAAAPHWGAALTALDEERRALRRNIELLERDGT